MPHPPGPAGHPILGHLGRFHDDPIGLLRDGQAGFGDVVGYRFLHLPVVAVSHPDDVRLVLVNPDGALVKGMATEAFRPLVGKGLLLNEGESHKRQRRLMAPAFHRQRVLGWAGEMTRALSELDTRWAPGQALDLAEEMNGLALTIATRTLFGTDLSAADQRAVSDAVSAFASWYHQTTHPLGPLLQLLPTATTRAFRAGRAALSDVVSRMIAARRAAPGGADILSMLVEARDEDGSPMGEDYVHDEVITLLVAGHETTAAALAWAWWLLATHPEVADRLAAEVDAVTGGAPPAPEHLGRLKLAEAVFAEALRLYPAALALPRQAVKPLRLGEHDIAPGTIVMAAAWCTHHDPRWWPDPDRFDPDRWTDAARAARPKFAYYPFGGGARACIGEAFAWMEGTLALATLAPRWRPRLPDGHRVEVASAFTLRPKGGLPVTLERR